MTATAPRKQLSPAWVLFILTGLNLFNYLDRFVLSAVLTPLQKDLGLNDGQAGRLVTAFMPLHGQNSWRREKFGNARFSMLKRRERA